MIKIKCSVVPRAGFAEGVGVVDLRRVRLVGSRGVRFYAEMTGIFRGIFLENLVFISTSLGKTLEYFGTSNTSSNVRPSKILCGRLLFIATRIKIVASKFIKKTSKFSSLHNLS